MRRLADRLSSIRPSQTLEVTARAAALRARGVDVIGFGAGEPDFDTPAHIRDAAKRAIDAGATKYTLVEGTPELRDAVAAWFGRAHGLRVPREEVLVSSGAKQALFLALHALLNQGDEIIVPSPCWVSYTEMAKLAGARPVLVTCPAEGGFQLRAEDVAAAVTPRTRAILLGSPCNPTGAVFGEEPLRAIADLVVARDLWLIVDDIYRTLVYGGASAVQPAAFSGEVRARTVVIDGVSKAYAMTGWRIGFALAAPAVIEAMATLQGQCTTHAASVSQAAALAAVRGPSDDLDRMRAEFDRRRRAMVAALRAIPGLTCVEPRGAFYAFPDARAYLGRSEPGGPRLEDDAALCRYLLEVGRIAVVPGSAFGAPGFLRLSYATSMRNVDEGMGRMASALRALR